MDGTKHFKGATGRGSLVYESISKLMPDDVMSIGHLFPYSNILSTMAHDSHFFVNRPLSNDQ